MIVANHPKVRQVIVTVAVCLFCVAAQTARAELSSSRARRAFTRMTGFELTSGAVRVRNITDTSGTTADVTAELRTVFRFEQDERGKWRVAEVRTAPDRWEAVTTITSALAASSPLNECNAPDFQVRRESADLSPKRVRCLLGSLFGVPVPSDAIRIQEIAPFVIPLASKASTTVVAWIRVDARAVSDSKGWRITEIRTGNHEWVNLDKLAAAVNQEKQRLARAELQRIAAALEKYRADRGAYVVSDSHAVLIDHLSPRYIRDVIRLDPWRQPYKYVGQKDRFTLVSPGPDGKDGTEDDIARSK